VLFINTTTPMGYTSALALLIAISVQAVIDSVFPEHVAALGSVSISSLAQLLSMAPSVFFTV
jgi:hypothetical protein